MAVRRLRRLGRFRRSITLELFTVMFLLLLLSLTVVVVGSGRFLRATGTELAEDEAQVARDIIDSSVIALEKEGEESLSQLVADKARQLDGTFEAVERI